jgi:hypothetical protein
LPRVIPVVYIHVHYSIYVIISLYLKAISCTPMRTCASMHDFPYLVDLFDLGGPQRKHIKNQVDDL